MAARRSILIADPDGDEVRELKQALGETYDVFVARDGSKALELSILKYPDLILFCRRCPLIGAPQFLRILRSNPRTEKIPLIILSEEPMPATASAGLLEGILIKPLNVDEVRARVDGVMRRLDAAHRVVSEEGAVSGSLDQISMADLLQIFTMNRRTGCLMLSDGPGGASAEIFLHNGRLDDAVTGAVRGEKALFRLVGWARGRFSFVPNRRATTTSLSGSTDSLLMEAMRQQDELKRLEAELPAPGATVERLVPPEAVPEGLHPVTAEIVRLTEFYPRVGDLIDRAHAPDLEVQLALRSLLTAGLIRLVVPETKAVRQALITQDELFDLLGRLRRSGMAPTFLARPKVAILCSDPGDLRATATALSHLPEFSPGDLAAVAREGSGTLGTLDLGGVLTIDFFALPPDDRWLPVALALSAGTIAGVVIGTSGTSSTTRLLSLLEDARRAGVLVVRRPQEAELEVDSGPKANSSARRTEIAVDDLSDASLERVLRTLLCQTAGQDLRGVTL